MTFQTASLFPMNIESARLAELMPAIGGLIQPVAAIQKWQAELSATPLWLLQTLLGVVSIAVCAVFLIGRSRFGREFWQVLKPCMGRRGALQTLAVSLLMIVLLLTEIRLYVLNTFLNSSAYSAMQDRLADVFWKAVLINAALMMIRSVNLIINDFLDQALAIKWSEQLNRVLTENWLARKNYYRLQMRRDAPDNIDQRIQMDAQDFIVSTITFSRGMLNSIVSTIEFTIVLWGLAGILPVFGFEIPHGIVFLVYIAILAATALAMWIGKPLIRSNYENEHLNGDYRYSLVRIRDHSESIAFYNGEWQEEKQLKERFRAIVRNRWRIARQSIGLSGFNDVFSQIMQLLPLMLQAPRLFAGQIKIGDVQQTVQSFARLQKSMSFFRNFYKDFTVYRARLDRLSGFMDYLDAPQTAERPQEEEISDGLILENVGLKRNNGDTLLSGISFRAECGDSLLIQGPSGCGKTSLLRTLAGWPDCGLSAAAEKSAARRAAAPCSSRKNPICRRARCCNPSATPTSPPTRKTSPPPCANAASDTSNRCSIPPTTGSNASRPANSSASPSPASCCPPRSSSCSTKPPPRWTNRPPRSSSCSTKPPPRWTNRPKPCSTP